MTDAVAPPLRGVYAITSAALCADNGRLVAYCEAALCGGIRLLQYRDKNNPPVVRQRLATILAGLCRHFRIPLIINDDVELAACVGAAGVHLGATDGSIAAARSRLGSRAIIGATCGHDLERAHATLREGATYVAFGRFFPSRTKPDAPRAPLELLPEARQRLRAPICAIGGIRPDNAAALVTAGVDLLAAVEGIFDHPDAGQVTAAVQRYRAPFDG